MQYLSADSKEKLYSYRKFNTNITDAKSQFDMLKSIVDGYKL